MPTVTKITREAIDIFVPEHGRTSCADEYPINGLDSADYGARCARCALLDIVQDYSGEVPDNYEVTLIVTKVERKEITRGRI